jgi:LysR family transcriptional activator of nhaA
VRPNVVAEFEDTALMHHAAKDGLGFIPVYDAIVAPAVEHYGWKTIGRARGCSGHFFAITAERKLKYPAILAITEHAQSRLFA